MSPVVEASESIPPGFNGASSVVNQELERPAMNQAPMTKLVEVGSTDSPESSLPTALVVGVLDHVPSSDPVLLPVQIKSGVCGSARGELRPRQ